MTPSVQTTSQHQVPIVKEVPAENAGMKLFQDKLAKQKSVDRLDLSACDFTDACAFRALLEVLQDSSTPTNVNLSGTKFSGKADFVELLSVLQNKPTVELNLSNYLCSDYVSSDGSLRRLLQSNPTLLKLDLSGHSFDQDIVADLTTGMAHNSNLQELKLHNCFLDDASATMVLDSATNLCALDLSSNNNFSTAFLNTSVASLLRRSNKITSLVFDHSSSMFNVTNVNDLAPFLQALSENTTLESFSLRYCRLNDAVGEALLKAVAANTNLTLLDMEFSGFGLRGAGNEILLKYLPKFKTLKTLKLITQYPARLAPRLLQAVQQNSSLHKFHPRVQGHAEHKQVQAFLERNRRLHQAQTLLQAEANVSAGLLPQALSHSARSSAGSAASYQVLRYWVPECL